MGKKKINKVENIIKIVSYIVIPLIIAIYGSRINNSIEKSKINARYIEIAIDILTDESSDQSLKKYATNIINDLSPVKLDKDAKQKLSSGEAFLSNDFFKSIILKDSNNNFKTLNESEKISQWINNNKPDGSEVKKSIGYTGNDIDSPYAVISFEKDNLKVGAHSQWWLFPKVILKAEGFHKYGRNSGWWNFYNKDGSCKISRLYNPNKKGTQSLVKSTNNGPMTIDKNFN